MLSSPFSRGPHIPDEQIPLRHLFFKDIFCPLVPFFEARRENAGVGTEDNGRRAHADLKSTALVSLSKNKLPKSNGPAGISAFGLGRLASDAGS